MRDSELIKTVHAENYSVYGARKVWRELLRQGHQVARCTVEGLMKAEGLTGAVRGKKVITTISDKSVERAPDLLKREFVAPEPAKTAGHSHNLDSLPNPERFKH